MDEVEAARTITAAHASEIQGLLNFAVSFYMGRGLKHLVSAFMPFAEGQQCKDADELVSLCSYARTMLRAQKPRVHSTLESNRPILIFTDGAYEDGVATAGAVVVDGSQRHAYVVTVPDELVKLWNRVAGDQIISQVELWALVSVRLCLRKQLLGRRVIEWIDNESTRMSAIKANSPSVSMRILARVLADLELQWPSYSWTERVCSFSNPADLPSRNKMQEATQRYNLLDKSMLDASDALTDLMLRLHQSP